jgi:hypothetical protein
MTPGIPYTQEQLAGEIWALEEANKLYPDPYAPRVRPPAPPKAAVTPVVIAQEVAPVPPAPPKRVKGVTSHGIVPPVPEPLPKPVPPQMPPLAKPARAETWAWTPDVFGALRDGFVLPRDANTKQILALLDLSLFRPGDPLEWIAAWCLTYRTIRNASVGQRVLAESAAYEATVVWCQHYPLEAERLRTRAKVKEALAQLGLGLKVVKP